MGDFFDPDLNNLISGKFNSMKVIEPGGIGGVGNLVIDPTKTFDIEVEWELSGPLTPLWLAALGGNWSVTAYAESIGPGPELLIKQDPVPVSSAVVSGTTRTWKHTLTVPAGTLDEENPGNPTGPSGTYKLVVTTFLNSTLGSPGFDVMGFQEGPVIKAEDPN